MYNYYSLDSSLAITFSSGSILAATSNNGSHTLFFNTISEAKSLPFNFPSSYLFMSPMPQHRPSVQLIGHPQQNPLRLQPWCVVKSLGTNSSAGAWWSGCNTPMSMYTAATNSLQNFSIVIGQNWSK